MTFLTSGEVPFPITTQTRRWRAATVTRGEELARLYRLSVDIVNLTVMAEHGVDDPVWDRPQGTGYPVRLADLGVTEDLVSRLREWNAQFQRALLDESLSEGSANRNEWVDHGLQLAYDLQATLRGIEVFYWEDGNRRPLRERRGA